jgi:hypothetical protein
MSNATLEGMTKPFVRPSKSPEGLAELVSNLPKQQQAEIMYELILFAALAAEDTEHKALNQFLSELESMAEVYTDPEKRRALRRTVTEDLFYSPNEGAGNLEA